MVFPAPECLLEAHKLVVKHKLTEDNDLDDLMYERRKYYRNGCCLCDLRHWAYELSCHLLELQETKLLHDLELFLEHTNKGHLETVHAFVFANETLIDIDMMDQLEKCKELKQKWDSYNASDDDLCMWAMCLMCLLNNFSSTKIPEMMDLVTFWIKYARTTSELGKRAREDEA